MSEKPTNNQFEELQKKLDLLAEKDKPGFFAKMFHNADSYVESKIGEENDGKERKWKKWEDISSLFPPDKLEEKIFKDAKTVFECFDRIFKDDFIRESGAYHTRKGDSEFRKIFLFITDLFDRYVECVYIQIFSGDEESKRKAETYCSEFKLILERYEQTIYSLVLKRIDREKKEREKTRSFFDAINE